MDRESDMAEDDMGMSRHEKFTPAIHPPLQKTGGKTAGSQGRKRSERI